VLQSRIAQENAIPTLVPLLVDSTVSEETRVEVAYTLACIVLCHADNLQQLQAEDKFSFDVVRRLLCSQSEVCSSLVTSSVPAADDTDHRTASGRKRDKVPLMVVFGVGNQMVRGFSVLGRKISSYIHKTLQCVS